jgi:glycosyltransferase involved in cell wall biosynthesis
VSNALPKKEPLRLGIWFYYGQTLPPNEGIGVFVHNLTAGLLTLPEDIEFTFLIRPGDESVVEPLRALAPDRVRVLPEGPLRVGLLNPRRMTSPWVRLSNRLRATAGRMLDWWDATRGNAWESTQDTLLHLLRQASYGKILGILGSLLCVPLLLIAAWCVLKIHSIVEAVSRIALAPLGYADELVRRCDVNPRFISGSLFEVARNAGCDIWVFPHIDVRQPVEFPAVIFIHDLIPYHFPELFHPGFIEMFKQTAPGRAADALRVACMSEVIKKQDLMGILGIPESKISVVPAVPPADLPEIPASLARRLLPRRLKKPFLLYPSAFRGYKNHSKLIEALNLLGNREIDLVFTGPKVDFLPPNLEKLARKHGVRQRIHVLGRVEREVLSALYQQAAAVVMPSLYEECAFPVYEAIRAGCPVACSDIPALREQFAGMGSAMRHFDPNSPEAIAKVIRELLDNREAIQLQQSQAGQALWNRTWQDVAAQWLEVFRQAVPREAQRKAA